MFVNLSPISTKKVYIRIINTDIECFIPPTYLLDILYRIDTLVKNIELVFICSQVDSSFTIDV